MPITIFKYDAKSFRWLQKEMNLKSLNQHICFTGENTIKIRKINFHKWILISVDNCEDAKSSTDSLYVCLENES